MSFILKFSTGGTVPPAFSSAAAVIGRASTAVSTSNLRICVTLSLVVRAAARRRRVPCYDRDGARPATTVLARSLNHDASAAQTASTGSSRVGRPLGALTGWL